MGHARTSCRRRSTVAADPRERRVAGPNSLHGNIHSLPGYFVYAPNRAVSVDARGDRPGTEDGLQSGWDCEELTRL